MKNVQSYNKELQIATAQFIDVFNNIKICRFDKNNTITQTIKVPIKYSSRSSALKSLLNPKKIIELPVIAFNRTSFNVDTEKIFNLNNEILRLADNDRDYTLYQPIPIDINFEMSIFSKYPTDDDQIVQNFVPFSMPNFYVAWKHPYTEESIKSQVIWSGDISTEYPIDLSEDESKSPRIISTTTFIYKTWLFPGSNIITGNGRSERGDIIHNISFDSSDINNINYIGGWYPSTPDENLDTMYNELIDGAIRIHDSLIFDASGIFDVSGTL